MSDDVLWLLKCWQPKSGLRVVYVRITSIYIYSIILGGIFYLLNALRI